MYRLSLLIFFLAFGGSLLANKNPHGKNFKMDCNDCHSPKSGWNVDLANMKFNHNSSTNFELEGQHKTADCKKCHIDLSFKTNQTGCVDCHQDIHQMTVGNDCVRCHTSNNWLVMDVQPMHEQNGFALEGRHMTVSCIECHKNANQLSFSRLGSECVDCHNMDYLTAQNPNHLQSGFSTDCRECHQPFSTSWLGQFEHSFFPLEKGHANVACAACHKDPVYSNISPECVSCHLNDYNGATQPNHAQTGFPTDCKMCHTTDVGWSPASFIDHDGLYFPIYSGNHNGVWSKCTECHNNPSNYAEFTCILCHEHNDANKLAGKHDDVNGYVYQSSACYTCHPDGSE